MKDKDIDILAEKLLDKLFKKIIEIGNLKDLLKIRNDINKQIRKLRRKGMK
jgi:hypothetical protein